MENCCTSSGKIFPLDILAITLCTKNKQVQVRLKRKQVCLIKKLFSARRATISHQTWSKRIASIFWTLPHRPVGVKEMKTWKYCKANIKNS